LNKGTAFSDAEREVLGLRGLLKPHVCSQEEQVARVLENFHRLPCTLEKYIFMTSLHDRNEVLFFRVVEGHHRRGGNGRRLHARGHRSHGALERAADRVCAVQPDVEVGMHRAAGL